MNGDPDTLQKLKEAADDLAAVDDNLLRAIAVLAAHGHLQIIPVRPELFGAKSRPMIVLPERM
ncbi:hypothetical protein [Paracoccus sp. KR1-242]|uniref:hypothetical protein n=1 Tax=Paracoccus sp. KR1-242 TaxID=3410028 RepID=UPI003C01C7E6